jgi:hypothetical protein
MLGSTTVLFASGAIVWLLACVLYMGITKMGNVPSPFLDSLSAQQIEVRKKSSYTRSTIFVASIVLAAGLVCIWKPVS